MSVVCLPVALPGSGSEIGAARWAGAAALARKSRRGL